MMESIQTSTDCVEVQDQTQTDEQLLLQYRQNGHRELFAALMKRYERELFNYLRRYLGDAGMAEDAFQATFLQVKVARPDACVCSSHDAFVVVETMS